MSIEDIKRAMVEVKNICDHHECYECPFRKDNSGKCRLNLYPLHWETDDWEDEQV
jgi:hypothetical protein